MRIPRLSVALVVALIAVGASAATVPPAPAAGGPFTDVAAFATKSGFRGVVAWQADRLVRPLVRYGPSVDELTLTATAIPGKPDTAGMAFLERLTVGETYWFVIEDALTGDRSEPRSLVARNAFEDWDGSVYTVDLVAQLDTPDVAGGPGSDLDLADIAAGVNILAERFYDAMDGFARVGNVIVTDTLADYGANVPFLYGTACPGIGDLADTIIETAPPFDTHTWGGFAIADPCTQIDLGRLGQLIAFSWQDDLHLGYTWTHELLHYAMDAPDLYGGNSDADCAEDAWDGSIMHNSGGWDADDQRWRLTELDRNETLTPCDMGSQPFSWDALTVMYDKIPLRTAGPVEHIVDTRARGNDDGGALKVWILDRQPGASTLESYTPTD